MADTSTDASPSVVVNAPVVADPESYAAKADERAAEKAAVEAGGEGHESPDDIVSLDREPEADAAEEAEGEPDPVEAEDAGEEDAGEDEDEAADEDDAIEMMEFDFGGNKLEVPKDSMPPELAGKVDEFVKGTWADYTRKSQDNADVAKSQSARGEALERLGQLEGEALTAFSSGLLVRQEIEQLQSYDLDALRHSSNPEDHETARQISMRLSSKQAQFQEILARVGEHDTATSEAQQAELARRSEEGAAILDKAIPEFSKKHAPDVIAYAVGLGMPQNEADAWAVNPMMTEMAYKAMLYDRMASKTPSAGNGTPRIPAKPFAPKARGGGSAGSTSNPAKMSMRQLAKHLDLPG